MKTPVMRSTTPNWLKLVVAYANGCFGAASAGKTIPKSIGTRPIPSSVFSLDVNGVSSPTEIAGFNSRAITWFGLSLAFLRQRIVLTGHKADLTDG